LFKLIKRYLKDDTVMIGGSNKDENAVMEKAGLKGGHCYTIIGTEEFTHK